MEFTMTWKIFKQIICEERQTKEQLMQYFKKDIEREVL